MTDKLPDDEHVKRVLAMAERFNEAVSDARRSGLLVDFTAQNANYTDRVAERIEVRSVYKSLHTTPRPIPGEDF
jgi:hypothetical protein